MNIIIKNKKSKINNNLLINVSKRYGSSAATIKFSAKSTKVLDKVNFFPNPGYKVAEDLSKAGSDNYFYFSPDLLNVFLLLKETGSLFNHLERYAEDKYDTTPIFKSPEKLISASQDLANLTKNCMKSKDLVESLALASEGILEKIAETNSIFESTTNSIAKFLTAVRNSNRLSKTAIVVTASLTTVIVACGYIRFLNGKNPFSFSSSSNSNNYSGGSESTTSNVKSSTVLEFSNPLGVNVKFERVVNYNPDGIVKALLDLIKSLPWF